MITKFKEINEFLEQSNFVKGRILYNIHRLKLGLSIHIVHIGKEQTEYYKWFK